MEWGTMLSQRPIILIRSNVQNWTANPEYELSDYVFTFNKQQTIMDDGSINVLT